MSTLVSDSLCYTPPCYDVVMLHKYYVKVTSLLKCTDMLLVMIILLCCWSRHQDYYLRRRWGYVFGAVCLFVCLSVRQITRKLVNGFW